MDTRAVNGQKIECFISMKMNICHLIEERKIH